MAEIYAPERAGGVPQRHRTNTPARKRNTGAVVTAVIAIAAIVILIAILAT